MLSVEVTRGASGPYKMNMHVTTAERAQEGSRVRVCRQGLGVYSAQYISTHPMPLKCIATRNTMVMHDSLRWPTTPYQPVCNTQDMKGYKCTLPHTYRMVRTSKVLRHGRLWTGRSEALEQLIEGLWHTSSGVQKVKAMIWIRSHIKNNQRKV
jgi:hypothetical protein